MTTSLSMEGHMNQVNHSLREKEESRIAERRRTIPYLILDYLKQHGFRESLNMLISEAQLSPRIQICDNIDLEIILMEYDSYYRMRFNRYPTLCKKVEANPYANATQNMTKTKTASKQKKDDALKDKVVQQTTNDNPVNEINLAMTVLPIFSNENEEDNSIKEQLDWSSERPTHSKISQCIEKLYSTDSELRKIAEDISKEIVLHNLNVHWDDVKGLEECKTSIKHAVVYPLKYPIFFSDKFSPWKGILLYGPPGTGKTMLAKAVATECNCTFFNITASSLVSKWRGDSEKYIRVLFDLAYNQSPTVIFIDEIDWIATKIENNSLSEPAKRFRAELLARLDGLVSPETSNVMLLAATNAPWNIDAALLRRLEKRIHVTLPDEITRNKLFLMYLKPSLKCEKDYAYILQKTKSYSAAEIKLICKQAWMLQSSIVWERLEKKEVIVSNLQYEITDLKTLMQVLDSTPSTDKLTNMYNNWLNHTHVEKHHTCQNKNVL